MRPRAAKSVTVHWNLADLLAKHSITVTTRTTLKESQRKATCLVTEIKKKTDDGNKDDVGSRKRASERQWSLGWDGNKDGEVLG